MNKIIVIDNEKIIILSEGKVFANLFAVISKLNLSYEVPNGKIKFSNFSFNDVEYLIDIYNLYEFSNQVIVVSESTQFGEIMNLVDTGLLTLEEAAEAILH